MKSFRYMSEVIRSRGWLFLWDFFAQSIWFDLRRGTQTSMRVAKNRQSIQVSESEVGNGVLYVASFTSVINETLHKARAVLGPGRFSMAQFVDLGCGKGKALIVFKQKFGRENNYPAIGVDYDTELTSLARKNIDAVGLTEADIRLVTDSATNFLEYTDAKTLIVYLYNPFQGETLRAVLSTIRKTPHILIYVDPAEKRTLSEFGYTVHFEKQGRYNADSWLVASAGLS